MPLDGPAQWLKAGHGVRLLNTYGPDRGYGGLEQVLDCIVWSETIGATASPIRQAVPCTCWIAT